MSLSCNEASYVGMMNVRTYDINYCIVVKQVFVIRQGNNLFGTLDFNTVTQFINYRNSICKPCAFVPTCCAILYNGCYVTFNGKKIGYGV